MLSWGLHLVVYVPPNQDKQRQCKWLKGEVGHAGWHLTPEVNVGCEGFLSRVALQGWVTPGFTPPSFTNLLPNLKATDKFEPCVSAK